MDRLLVGARRIEIDVLGDFGLDRAESRPRSQAWRRSRPRSQCRAPHPAGASVFTACSIHVAAGAAKSRSQSTRSTTRLPPSAASRSSMFLADRAELRIGGIAECEHAEFHAIEPRRGVAHQFVVGAYGACRRLAFAPGRGDDDEAVARKRAPRVEIGHVDQSRLEAVLARGLAEIGGELFGIPGFGRVDDGQRLGRRAAAQPAAALPPRLRGRPGSPRARRAGSRSRARRPG